MLYLVELLAVLDTVVLKVPDVLLCPDVLKVVSDVLLSYTASGITPITVGGVPDNDCRQMLKSRGSNSATVKLFSPSVNSSKGHNPRGPENSISLFVSLAILFSFALRSP